MQTEPRANIVFGISTVFAAIFGPPRGLVVRAFGRGAGGRGSILDRVTPKTLKWELVLLGVTAAFRTSELSNRLVGSESVLLV